MAGRSWGRVVSAATLALWLAIFFTTAIYPDMRSFLGGLRGRDGWRTRFVDHARLRDFISSVRSPATANGGLLFAYGDHLVAARDGNFAVTAKYLLFPARMFSNTRDDPAIISRIAILDARETGLARFSFCQEVQANSYLCSLKPGGAELQGYEIGSDYRFPELILTARRIAPRSPNSILHVFSIFFDLERLPAKHGLDLDQNVVATGAISGDDARGDAEEYRVHFPIGEPQALQYLRFRLFVVDHDGVLHASDARPVVTTGTQGSAHH